MMAIAVYLLKVSVCLTAFYALYIMLFKEFTFFRFNRYYLLAGIAVSFLIPVLNVSLFDHNYDTLLPLPLENSISDIWIDANQIEVRNNTGMGMNYSLLFTLLYFGGVTTVLIRMLISVKRIIVIRNNSKIHSLDDANIFKTKLSQPFSFYNLIFLPEYDVNPLIIEHENAHVIQNHWIDLILVELAHAALWFNPLMIFYKRAIKLQHEYLADAVTLTRSARVEQYLECLLLQVQRENSCGPVSQFYSTSIKKRIHMITKTKTSVKYLWAYALLLPVLCLLLSSFSNTPAEPFPVAVNDASDENIPSIVPLGIGEPVVIESNFGYRMHPILKRRMFHTGIDFGLAEGNKVITSADGIVLESRSDSLWGNYVVVKHGVVYTTQYSHLKSSSVNVGDLLKKGQLIGYVGNTGLSTAPHLHYEVRKNGEPVDPRDYFPKSN